MKDCKECNYNKDFHAKVAWHTDDILSLKPEWSKEMALEFFNDVGEDFAGVLTQYGWEILEIALDNWEQDNAGSNSQI